MKTSRFSNTASQLTRFTRLSMIFQPPSSVATSLCCTEPASWRATAHLNDWLRNNNLVAITDVEAYRDEDETP